MLDIAEFDIVIAKITKTTLINDALHFSGVNSFGGLATVYERGLVSATQMFEIKMYNIPLGCSAYFSDTSEGKQHYTDNTADMDEASPVNHMMILSAKHLIDLMQRTLPDMHTALLIEGIQLEMQGVDPALARIMKLKGETWKTTN